ncbi:MAG: tail fiber domain-containing protein [Candidatus Manganitrophus sp. SB1]|nr:tail fiber domain-containing protein [Candidatus Manganitrophus morganii]
MANKREIPTINNIRWFRNFYLIVFAVSLWVLGDAVQAQTTSCQVGAYDCAGQLYLYNGNVGIGTASPALSGLHIHNVGSANQYLKLTNIDTGAGDLDGFDIAVERTSKRAFIIQRETADLILRTSNIDRMRIDSSGNVGIGTAGPAYKLDVAGAAHASSFPTSSDLRLKTNVAQLTGALEKLQKIRGVAFDWNEQYVALGRSTGHREIGVVAQEVEAVFPELVTHWGSENYRAVDYGRLTAVMIEAIKELKAKNDTLEAENKKMKERETVLNEKLIAIKNEVAEVKQLFIQKQKASLAQLEDK